MKVKNYYASNPYEAFKRIREELGSDALILQSQKVRRRGWRGLLGTPVYEVKAAADSSDDAHGAPTLAAPQNTSPQNGAALVRDAFSLASELQDLKESLTNIQESLNQRNGQYRRQGRLSPQLSRLRDLLLSRGLDAQITDNLVKQIALELSRKSLQDWSTVSDAATRHLERLLITNDLTAGKSETPLVVFVVGTSGVGKTTSIAKLAATFGDASIALVSTDVVRIGAIPQLQAYADILGLPLKIAYTPQELARTVKAPGSADVILIDTPAAGPKSPAGVNLREYLSVVDSAVVLLTIGATTKGEDVLRAVQEFEGIPMHGLIITKLDEATSLGSVFNVAQRCGLPITYVSDGPHEPTSLKPANTGMMVRTLFEATI
ncbi:MAG: hypothetical protein M1358_17360 [Chloroflexi bacterium]|nr:hypothetical protein [Chloroflexota bacterium]